MLYMEATELPNKCLLDTLLKINDGVGESYLNNPHFLVTFQYIHN